MDSQRFDVWLQAFKSNSDEPAAQALARIFGISVEMAARLLTSLPRVVRKDAPVLQAQRITSALESIGGRAEMVLCPLRPAPVVKVGDAPVQDDSLPTPPSVHPPAQRVSPAQTLVMPTSGVAGLPVASLSPSELHPRSPLDVAMVLDPPHSPVSAGRLEAGLDPPLDAWRDLLVDPRVYPHADPHADPRVYPHLDPHLDPLFESTSTPDVAAKNPLAPPRVPSFDTTHVPRGPRTVELGDPASTLDLASLRPIAPVDLALPAMDSLPPSLEAALRRPSMRARDPHLRTPSSRPPGPAPRPALQTASRALSHASSQASSPPTPSSAPGIVLGPLALSFNMVAQAKPGSWQDTLRSHPASGFLVVLLGTTLLFWLLYVIAV